MNSVKNIIKAIENEIQDQKEIYLKNGEFKQLTKRFDEATKSNKVMRVKETINDYHYY
jgi:aspartyl-tRNA(Asn)/glutamyl-tRNA(Gln) amidotransferase subunit B